MAKVEIVQWYGDVETGAAATVYIEDGAKIYFYGNTLTINLGATIFGTSDWVTFNAGTGTGRIIFQKPNPRDNSTNQQVLIGGNAGGLTAKPSAVYIVQIIEEGKFAGTFKLVKE